MAVWTCLELFGITVKSSKHRMYLQGIFDQVQMGWSNYTYINSEIQQLNEKKIKLFWAVGFARRGGF